MRPSRQIDRASRRRKKEELSGKAVLFLQHEANVRERLEAVQVKEAEAAGRNWLLTGTFDSNGKVRPAHQSAAIQYEVSHATVE